jgi:hypothetical protein
MSVFSTGFGSTALAQWSFDFAGAKNDFVYGRYGQLGHNGFFGVYDVDASSLGGRFAPVNGWIGNRLDIGETVSGTNASFSSTSLAAQPRFGNQWVEVTGRYTIQSYQTSSTSGTYVAMSPGQLTLWTIAMDTPLGTISWGKQEYGRGFGLQLAASRSEEYLALEKWVQVPNILQCLVCSGFLPRGVLSWFNPGTWPMYSRKRPDPEIKPQKELDKDGYVRFKLEDPKCFEGECYDKDETFLTSYTQGSIGPADLLLGLAIYPWQRIQLAGANPITGFNPWNENDLNASRGINYALYFLYATPDLTFGAGGTRVSFHIGPELQSTVAARSGAPTTEQSFSEGWVFVNYNNRVVSLRSELDWFNRLTRYQRSSDGTFFGTPDNVDGSGSMFATDYQESWRFMVELGCLQGPVSAKVFYSFMPGPDRRHGILIDKQPFIQDEIRAAFGVFEPYSIVLSYFFGGGVDAPAHINDAAVYAAKVDYMLAANLIVEASFLKAYRTSHGYGWGYIRPSAATFGSIDYNSVGSYTNPSPSIPENDLGWEVTAGVTWKLLEEFVVAVRGAYWQPGRWFNYACIDKAVPNWDIPVAANNWGVNPNRDIDAVMGLEFRLSGSF